MHWYDMAVYFPSEVLLGFVVLAAMIGFGTPLASGQDDVQVTEVDPGSVFPEAMVTTTPPIDLPGHEKGKRTRPPEPAVPPLEEPAVSEWFGGEPWWTWSGATGDWAGARRSLEDSGISITGSLVLDWSSVLAGGIQQRSATRHLLDFNITFDLETIFGVQGATFFADFYSQAGPNASDNAGDFQGFSNIDLDDDVDQLAELWYEQWLFENAIRIKVGKVDANSEFAFIDAAASFINSSPGVSPTILGLPTYPDPATSVNVFAYPTEHLYLGFGLYDGAQAVDGVATGRRGPRTFFGDDRSDDFFLIGEAGFTWDGAAAWGPGRFAVGAWHHTGDFETFGGATDEGTEGLYVLLETHLGSPPPGGEDQAQGVSVFFQYGYADEDVSDAKHHFGGGLSLLGTFLGREQDTAGAYLSYVDLSDADGAGFVGDETALELFYKFQITPFISVQPGLQIIWNPSGRDDIDDAVIGAVRMELTF